MVVLVVSVAIVVFIQATKRPTTTRDGSQDISSYQQNGTITALLFSLSGQNVQREPDTVNLAKQLET